MPGRAGMLCPNFIPEYMGLHDCPWLFILGWSKGLVALAGTRPAQRTDERCCMVGYGRGSWVRALLLVNTTLSPHQGDVRLFDVHFNDRYRTVPTHQTTCEWLGTPSRPCMVLTYVVVETRLTLGFGQGDKVEPPTQFRELRRFIDSDPASSLRLLCFAS
jgi:hypothetical protein